MKKSTLALLGLAAGAYWLWRKSRGVAGFGSAYPESGGAPPPAAPGGQVSMGPMRIVSATRPVVAEDLAAKARYQAAVAADRPTSSATSAMYAGGFRSAQPVVIASQRPLVEIGVTKQEPREEGSAATYAEFEERYTRWKVLRRKLDELDRAMEGIKNVINSHLALKAKLGTLPERQENNLLTQEAMALKNSIEAKSISAQMRKLMPEPDQAVEVDEWEKKRMVKYDVAMLTANVKAFPRGNALVYVNASTGKPIITVAGEGR